MKYLIVAAIAALMLVGFAWAEDTGDNTDTAAVILTIGEWHSVDLHNADDTTGALVLAFTVTDGDTSATCDTLGDVAWDGNALGHLAFTYDDNAMGTDLKVWGGTAYVALSTLDTDTTTNSGELTDIGTWELSGIDPDATPDEDADYGTLTVEISALP